MAQICPRCTADTEPLEEETDRFCLHEKLAAVSVIAFVAGILVGAAV